MVYRLLVWILALPLGLVAQVSISCDPIICYHNNYTEDEWVPAPAAFLAGEVLPSANLNLLFGDSVPAVAQASLTYAAALWGVRLRSAVPVRIEVDWDDFEEENVLAAAGPTALYRDFPGAIAQSVWYPVAVAESIVGDNLNEDQPDIRIQVNSKANWYYGLDGQVPPGKIDLVTVTLHELGHGLGFVSSADTVGIDQAEYGFSADLPLIYDVYMESAGGLPVTDAAIFPNPSEALFDVFTDNSLFFGGPLAIDAFGGERPPLYAPEEFNTGSSVSHLDEFVFAAGLENALMSPRLSRQEAIHDPGPVTLAIMAHLGWDVVFDLVPVREVLAGDLACYPNPAHDRINISLPTTGDDWQLHISDSQGRTVRLARLRASELATERIDDLAPGWYLLSLSNGRQLYRNKLVVSR